MKKTVILLLLLTTASMLRSAEEGTPHIKRDFFAFDNGLQQIKSFDDKAALLKEYGYAGVGWRTGVRADEMVEALDKQGLKNVAPYLKLVSMNGAESGATMNMAWNKLIQPLGQGSFDNSKVLKLLDEIGYQGPIGLQCYSVKGDNRINLKQSADAWNVLQ